MTNPLDEVPVTLTLKATQVNYIMSALSVCPFREAAPIISELKTQGDAAMAAYREPVALTQEEPADTMSGVSG